MFRKVKFPAIYFFFLILLLLGFACGGNKKNSSKSPADLITIRTFGLAYLEEFKLDEAEIEFLKFIIWHPIKSLDMQIWD